MVPTDWWSEIRAGISCNAFTGDWRKTGNFESVFPSIFVIALVLLQALLSMTADNIRIASGSVFAYLASSIHPQVTFGDTHFWHPIDAVDTLP